MWRPQAWKGKKKGIKNILTAYNMQNQSWQVVSQPLAVRMKELGFKQESLFYWVHKSILPDVWSIGKQGKEKLSAYTVAELGELLKEESHNISYVWQMNGKILSAYEPIGGKEHYEYGDTEADSRAKMLIYLKENDFI